MFQGDLVLDLIIEVITGDGSRSKRASIQLLHFKIFLHREYSSIQVLEHSSIQVLEHSSIQVLEHSSIQVQLFRIFIHPEYSATALTNDIAVLVLEKPISITEMVSPVCIVIMIFIIIAITFFIVL